MLAVITVRREPHYRREAFEAGLRRAGYTLADNGKPTGPRDLLVQWNRKPREEERARHWEQAGGTVLVTENGYIGKDAEGRQNYALSAHAHNGAGWFPVTDEDRFAALNITPQPWRTSGNHLLVCAQRGIGSKQMASPPDWHISAKAQLLRTSARRVMVRLHPGNQPPKTRLEDDLDGAWAGVIWSSGSGVKALIEGYPVFYDAPRWICEGAAVKGLDDIDQPVLSDELRLAAFQRMAHGQWFISEIESGEPFVRFRDGIEDSPPWQ
jgi:hypothetical protein